MAGSHQDSLEIRLGGFTVRLRGREFADADDYWDGNWLEITATCRTRNSSIELAGPYLRLDELVRFEAGLATLNTTGRGVARLDCMEPNLDATVQPSGGDATFDVVVEITPDSVRESHAYRFEIGEGELAEALEAIRTTLHSFPVRGEP